MPLFIGPRDVVCPNCNAQRGEPCTQPDDTGRHAVKFLHIAREDALEKARAEQ